FLRDQDAWVRFFSASGLVAPHSLVCTFVRAQREIMDHATARRRLALFALFFLPGLGISSWVTRTPDIRDLLGVSTADMGLILFGLSAGSMIGILGSGALVTRLGTRPVVTVGLL